MTYRHLFVLGLVVGVYACTQAGLVEREKASPNRLVGAWKIAQTSVTGPSGTSINENPAPGLYIFTERHFSNMLIPGSERQPFSVERTEKERLAAYDNFIADGGTYEYTDSTLTAKNIIAKVPNVMPPHSTGALTYRWRFDGDVLVLTLHGGWAPPNGEIAYRLERLE
jgi:hypothetical protein